jgi:UDP-glucose 4-epimerase
VGAVTILVTGGLGFIGSHTAHGLFDLGESCVLTRHRAGGPPDFLAGERIAVEPLDCADAAAFLELGERHEITGIVHLAATPTGVLDPIDTLAVNTQCVLNAFRAAREWEVRRISVASTLGAYLGVDEDPFRENVPLPVTPVDSIPVQKTAAELFAALIVETEGLDAVSLRLSTIWGPLGSSPSPYFALPGMVRAAVRGEAPDVTPPAYGDDGSDLLYVKDCARDRAAAARRQPQPPHLEGRRRTRHQEPRRRRRDRRSPAGATIDLPPGRDPHGSGRDSHLDIAPIHQDTGYRPQYGIERGIADYIAWLQAGHER